MQLSSLTRCFICALLLLWPASAQIPGGGGNFQCTANDAVPPQLRSEGTTELLGDITLNCSGGTPTPAGMTVPTANFVLYLNGTVTSRLLSAATSEALLIVDEPGSGLQGTVSAQTMCTGAGGVCTIMGTGTGVGIYDGSPGRPNIFPGVVSGSSVTFYSIPIDPPGASGGARIFRFTNLRVNAEGITGGGPIPANVVAAVAISGSTSVPINNPQLINGFIAPSLTFGVRSPDNSSASDGVALSQCAAAQRVGVLRFTENFGTAFKTRTTAAFVDGETSPTPVTQNVPGFIYNTESGFYAPGFPSPFSAGGLADSGTRLRATLNNIPTGSGVYVSARNVLFTNGGPSAASTGTVARLTQGELTPFTPLAPTTTLDGVPAVQLPVTNGSATAVWEVLGAIPSADENFDFVVWVQAAAGAGTASVNGTLAPAPPAFNLAPAGAPSSTLPLPRFGDNSVPFSLFTPPAACAVPITVQTSPAGLQLSVDGTTYTAPQTFNFTSGSSHTIAAATQAGATGVQYVFANWSDSGAASHSISTPATYTATFTTQYYLTTSNSPLAGGSITPASGWFNSGSVISVTATANTGYKFTGFSGVLAATTSPQNLTLSAPASVTANYAANITVTTSPTGLSLTVDGIPCLAPCTFQWAAGSSHAVAVIATQYGGPATQYVFSGWSDSGGSSHNIVVTAAATYTASFSTQYQLTTAVSPWNGGTVLPGSGGYYAAGTAVNLTALPSANFTFAYWGGGAAMTGANSFVVVNGPQTVTAYFNPIVPPQVSPTTLSLDYNPGQTPPTTPASLRITMQTNTGFVLTSPVTWLTVTPTSGNGSASVSVTAAASAMAPGSYSTTLQVACAGWPNIPVPVQLTVIGLPQLSANPPSVALTTTAGSTTIQSQAVAVTTTQRNLAVLAVPSGGAWLSVAPSNGSTPFSPQINADPTGLAAGSYSGAVTLIAPDAANSPVTIAVTLTVQASTPVKPPASMILTALQNAGSGASGSAAPNTLEAAMGTFPGCTAGAQVMVDRIAANVFASTPTQINFLVPDRVMGEASADVQVSCAGLTSEVMPLAIANNAPALLTVTQNGAGQAVVINQDGSVDTPSPAGTAITLYGTGFGMLEPPGPDGLSWLAQQVTATVGGITANVLYAGEAPGYTSGLQQLNVQLPAGLPTGQAVSIQLTAGGVSTQTGVTLAIQ